MVNLIYSPQKVDFNRKNVFMAGSIDNGAAQDWYSEIHEILLRKYPTADFDLLSPRRKNWNATCVQSVDNDEFCEQLKWETIGLEKSDIVLFNFLADSKSPITLLELGTLIGKRPNRIIVHCPDGFYRKGNVDYVCMHNRIPQVNSLDELCENIVDMLEQKTF